MSKQIKQFVFAKKKFELPTGDVIRQYDVGLIKSLDSEKSSILFIRAGLNLNVASGAIEYFNVDKTGDQFPKKICNVCHRLLDTSFFARNQNGKNNRPVRRPSCLDCRKGLEGVGLSPNVRREWLFKKPDHEPFVCPICLKRTIPGVTSKVVLDHDHKTGKVRGWICDSCNTGIGRFKDDASLVQRAIKFLK